MLEALPTTLPSSVRIRVMVSPRACGDEVLGWADGALKVKVAAPGRKGRADAAVETLLAEVLDVPRHRVHVVAGRGTRRKCVEITGCDEDQLERRLPGRDAPVLPVRATPPVASSAVRATPARKRRTAPAVARAAAH